MRLGRQKSSMIMPRIMPASLFLVAILCSCPNAPKQSEPAIPLAAHLIPTDGTPVSDAPEPEVVQLKEIETIDNEKHVTVENVAGEYVLVCLVAVNDKKKVYGQSCLSPRPQQNYLLFRENTRWFAFKGAKTPVSLAFMQDWSVTYNRGENIGLMSAKKADAETFGVYWLLSWKGKSSSR